MVSEVVHMEYDFEAGFEWMLGSVPMGNNNNVNLARDPLMQTPFGNQSNCGQPQLNRTWIGKDQTFRPDKS